MSSLNYSNAKTDPVVCWPIDVVAAMWLLCILAMVCGRSPSRPGFSGPIHLARGLGEVVRNPQLSKDRIVHAAASVQEEAQWTARNRFVQVPCLGKQVDQAPPKRQFEMYATSSDATA
jgi:hypothetical protein